MPQSVWHDILHGIIVVTGSRRTNQHSSSYDVLRRLCTGYSRRKHPLLALAAHFRLLGGVNRVFPS